MDIDGEVIERATHRLRQAGYTPTLRTVDASLGLSGAATFDHVLSTCSWSRIPLPWLAEVCRGGVILSHLYTDFDAGAMVRLTVADAEHAEGRFLPRYGAFMPGRGHRRQNTLALLEAALRAPDDGVRGPSAMLATELISDDFSLFVALRMPGVGMHWFQPQDAETMRTWLLGDDGSWAYQVLEHDELVAVQGGRRRLWDEVERLHREWVALHRPARERFGLTVSHTGHHVWLDEPTGAVGWALD